MAKRDGKGVTKGVALGVVLRLQYPFPYFSLVVRIFLIIFLEIDVERK